jgi:hypothetical protein
MAMTTTTTAKIDPTTRAHFKPAIEGALILRRDVFVLAYLVLRHHDIPPFSARSNRMENGPWRPTNL